MVLGVVAYNRVQESRARRAAARAFGGPRPDALMGEGAPEPERPAPRPASAPAEPPGLDERLDYLIELHGGEVTAAKLQERWGAIARRHGARANLEHTGSVWRAGLQLVNRDGTVGEAELVEFRAGVEDLASALGASTRAPEMKAGLEAARALDALCAETDIQVVLHVVAPPEARFAGTKLRAAAESSGLALEAEGRFALRTDEGALLYTLGARDGEPFTPETMRTASPDAVSLAMDVPRAPETQRTFESMARLSLHLAAVLGGTLVDDNGNALDERALAAIAAQLEAVRSRLEAQGFPPGSVAARRLFA